MPKSVAFEAHHERYEEWFDRHPAEYVSELLALRPFVPWRGHGLEVGVGSGRFAAPLGIQTGIDPAAAMLVHAARRGIDVITGIAENLPFASGHFDHVLGVTVLCFVDSPESMLAEVRRVLKPGGKFVLGFINRDSVLGQRYLASQNDNVFYRDATIRSVEEVSTLLRASGFAIDDWGQTLTRPLDESGEIEPLRAGNDEGGFVIAVGTSRS